MSKTRFLPLWLTKIGERRWFLSFHHSPTSHGKVRRENLYSEGLGVYKELISQVGPSWDNWKCTIIWMSKTPFLVGCTRLYNLLCPLVGWSVSHTLCIYICGYFVDILILCMLLCIYVWVKTLKSTGLQLMTRSWVVC